MSNTDSELECLQSERNFNLPDEISICTRWKPYSYQNIRSYWSLALGIGNRNLFKNVYEDGFLYGVWESGPWIGFKLPGTSAMGWIGGGTAVYDFLIWRHTCFSLSRSTGKFKLIENGEKAVDKLNPEIIDWMNQIPQRATIFTLGCYYREGGSGFMSMYGSVTDAHMFSRELTDQEMMDFTTCQSSLKGDISAWDSEQWRLISPKESSEIEFLDLEKDICHAQKESLFMVPFKLSYKESLHMCKKLSGTMMTYINQTEYDNLLYFISHNSNMKSSACVDVGEETSNINIWGGATDGIIEGVWETWNTREPIKVHIYPLFEECQIASFKILSSIYHGPITDLIMMVIYTIVWLLIQF